MEHLLIHIVVETIQKLDRRLQKPLAIAIPELPLLRADPQRYLANTPITFGPRRRQVLAAALGIGVGALVCFILMFFFKRFGPPAQKDPTRLIGVVVTFVIVTFSARTIFLWMMPGGWLTLRPEGAELTYKDCTLFLPWDLLQASGAAFEPDQKIVVLPINAQVPVALRDLEGNVRAVMPEQLEAPQAECRDFSQLAIKDLYEVRIGEVGELLRELGLRLGSGTERPEQLATAVAPLVVPEDKGWLHVQLTQLPFPPYCAGCGDATAGILLLNVGTGSNRMFGLPLPFCDPCSRRRTRWRWLGALIGAAGGFALGMIVGLNTLPPRRNPGAGVMVGMFLGLTFAIGMALLAQLIAREALTPVRCKEYKPEKGTLKLRLRWPGKAAPLLHALGLEYRDIGKEVADSPRRK